MSAHDIKLFGDQIAASRLEGELRPAEGVVADPAGDRGPVPRPDRARLELRRRRRPRSCTWCPGVDPATPVIFVDTGPAFPETLAYRDELWRGSA